MARCDIVDDRDFLLDEDWAQLAASRNQPDRLISAEEMRDMICEEMHELDRDFVYSRLLKMGPVFRSSAFFSLMLYFDNLYMSNEE